MGESLANAVRAAIAGGLVAALAACWGDAPRPPIVIATPEPVRSVIAQTSFSGFETDAWVSIDLPLSQRGVLDVTVDWTLPDTWMYVYFGRTRCDYAQLSGGTCPFLIASETKDPKPRVFVTEMLEAETYHLVLYNVPRNRQTGVGSDNTESVAIQLGLTVGASGQRSTDTVRLGRPTIVSPPRL
jgi:hypothetical protein